MSLERYRRKRDFSKTPEPAGKLVENADAPRYVIHKHAASRLHYDFRLESNGVLLSWAVPKGPSLDPADKRLAVHVEDHPVEYGGFEGIIPEGEYGGGSVIVWDRGHWYPEGDADEGYERGNLKFRLDGEKLQGSFALVRMHGPRSDDGKNWLLIKHDDEAANEDGELLVRDRPESVETGRTVEEVAADPDRMWRSNRDGKKGGEQVLSAKERRANARKPKPGPAAANPEAEDAEEIARKRLGLPPRAAARTTARKTGRKKASKAAATKKTTAKKTAKKATAKKATTKKATTKKATAKKAAAKKTAKRSSRAGKTRESDASTSTAAGEATRKRITGSLGDSSLPASVQPELATLVESVPPGPKWLHEVKLDGYRLIARIDGDSTQLLTRGGEDWSPKLPWLVAALRARVGADTALLDGELVHLGVDGITRFGELQQALSKERHDSLVYFVFDLLHLQGLDLRPMPLDQRKQALAELLPPEPTSGRVRLSELILGKGESLFTHACELGLEGVMSKRRDAPYRSGRHRDWLKIKCGKRQEAVIGGFTPARSGTRDIGALLLGVYDDAGAFVYCGKVGSGFDHPGATRLRARLDELIAPRSPFSKMPPGFSRSTFVRPEIVVEIGFTDWTSDGRMRHPVFEGVREDKPAREIRREKVLPVEKAAEPTKGSRAKAAVKPPAKAIAEATRTAAKPTSRVAKKTAVTPAKRRSTASRGGDIEVLGVRISHPDRVLYPADEIRKRDIAEYYASVAEWMMPWVERRPISVVRCPDDIDAPCFFQKHIHHELPPGVATADLDGEDGDAPFIYVDSPQGLVGLAQGGTLEMHIWGSTVDRPEDPDRIIFDLDPDEKVPWSRVKETAVALRTRLADLDLESFLKTTGGKGLHVVLPLTPGRQDWDQVKGFAHNVALELVRAAPDMFTATATKAKRTGKIYIDYLRNYRGSTSIAPYSARARPGAPVSVPLRWDELDALETSTRYTIQNLAARLSALESDPWRDLPKTRQFLRAKVLRAVTRRG